LYLPIEKEIDMWKTNKVTGAIPLIKLMIMPIGSACIYELLDRKQKSKLFTAYASRIGAKIKVEIINGYDAVHCEPRKLCIVTVLKSGKDVKILDN